MVNNSADRPPIEPRADGTTPIKLRPSRARSDHVDGGRAKPALTSPDWTATVTPLKAKPKVTISPATQAVIAALENEIADMKSGRIAPTAFILLTTETLTHDDGELCDSSAYVALGLNRAEVVGNLFALATNFSMGEEE